MMPVYIRNLESGSLLELTEKGEVEFKPLDGPRSEYQQWYIKYVNGYGGTTFMIISKKNGKALQMSGDEVMTTECDDEDVFQLWRRDGLYIRPRGGEHDHGAVNKAVAVENKSNRLVPVIKSEMLKHQYLPEKWIYNYYFEIQHTAVESYF